MSDEHIQLMNDLRDKIAEELAKMENTWEVCKADAVQEIQKILSDRYSQQLDNHNVELSWENRRIKTELDLLCARMGELESETKRAVWRQRDAERDLEKAQEQLAEAEEKLTQLSEDMRTIANDRDDMYERWRQARAAQTPSVPTIAKQQWTAIIQDYDEDLVPRTGSTTSNKDIGLQWAEYGSDDRKMMVVLRTDTWSDGTVSATLEEVGEG